VAEVFESLRELAPQSSAPGVGKRDIPQDTYPMRFPCFLHLGGERPGKKRRPRADEEGATVHA